MTHFSALLVAATLATSTVFTAHAAQTSATPGTDSSAATVSTLSTDIVNGAKVDLKGVSDATIIKVVGVSSLDPALTDDAMDEAISAHADEVGAMRAAADTNPVLKERIESAGYEPVQMVFAMPKAGGLIDLYVDDLTDTTSKE